MKASKRQNSSTRHKVDRKKKEAKRDIRKAANAMKSAGMGNNRKKKSREAAKSALRMSKISANKEAVLNQLLKVREHQKATKLQRRADGKAIVAAGGHHPLSVEGRAAAAAAAEAAQQARGKRNRDGEESDDEEEEEFDEEEEEDEGEEEEEDEEGDAEEEAPIESKDPKTKLRQQRRLFIPGNMAAHPQEQFRRYLDLCVFPQLDTESVADLPWEAPNFAVPTAIVFTVDARCAVQSAPWGELDYLMTLASEAQSEQEEMDAALEHQKQQKLADKKAGKKHNTKQQEAEDEAGELTVKPYVKPLVVFVLTKADTVAAKTIAAQYKLLSDALYSKYGYELPGESEEDLTQEELNAKKQNGERRLLSKAELPVEFSFAPFSYEVEGSTRQVMRILREYGQAFHQQIKHTYPDDKSLISHNLPNGKLAVVLYGLPKTGKSSLLRAMCTVGTDSAVAVAPCKSLFIQASLVDDPNNRPDVNDPESMEAFEMSTRILIPSPKQLTVVTFPDDQTFNRTALIGGDMVFYGTSTLERIEAPETIAVMLLSQFPDMEVVAQNFSCAMPGSGRGGDDEDIPKKSDERTAMSILKSLGRSIMRERGFLPSVYAGATAETTPGAFGTPSVLSASSVKDATVTAISGRRVVRVWPKKSDSKNAMRIGSRTFLKEFTTSDHFPWAVLSSADQSLTLDNYRFPCIFNNKYFSKKDFGGEIPASVAAESVIPKAVAPKKAQAANSATFQAGLLALQSAMMAYLILLPKISIAVDPMSVVPHQYDYFVDGKQEEDEVEEGDDEEEEYDEEEEEMDGQEFIDDEAEEGEEFDDEDEEMEFEDEDEEEEGEWSDEDME